MTNKEIYREYLQQLQQIYNANEAGVITDWVFERVAILHRADIIKNPGDNLNPAILKRLNLCLEALVQHKPVQYILGEAWFYRMKLVVNEQVLIPRPETEELVQLIIDTLKTGKSKEQLEISNPELSASSETPAVSSPLAMLDIGTGSGCIAIAIKKNLPGTIMHAIDVSPGALSVAKKNAINQQVDIRFLLVDFLDETSWEGLPVFDVIISNPPYIPLNEKAKLDQNVTAFEPHTALFVPNDAPLLFYEKIAAFGGGHLHRNGKIYVEIHEDFAKATGEVFEKFYRVEIKNDLFGKERMLIAAKL